MDIKKVRANLKKKREIAEKRNHELLQAARADFAGIVEMLIRDYHPRLVYQWGSLLHENEFSEISDIDIAIEADLDPKSFFAMLTRAQSMTTFPLDLVELDKIHPLHAESIRKRGRLIYERP